MKQILTLTHLLLLLFFVAGAQENQLRSFQLFDAVSLSPVPYAHIIHEGNLVTMTDYYGNFKLKNIKANRNYSASCMGYEVRLNPQFKFALGYNYFVPLAEREKYYLQEKYGFLNLLTRKHDLSTEQISWSENQTPVNSLPRLFQSHSIDVSFILSIQK